ncbi:Cyclic AMP response element-binding protein A [Strongyloides ratti]|uniref:Cyclic AMP response element-binding protein A n=1 Tax=Strongyloides ratti TaxID=34506 RepID=A0A090KZ87_STRRB|nr:Cyclic AMP response element-binding protein A [Strongyloides ratti]CEF60549.1 Cyclic AMP response element-binding protein A [Strongyloides ratti]
MYPDDMGLECLLSINNTIKNNSSNQSYFDDDFSFEFKEDEYPYTNNIASPLYQDSDEIYYDNFSSETFSSNFNSSSISPVSMSELENSTEKTKMYDYSSSIDQYFDNHSFSDDSHDLSPSKNCRKSSNYFVTSSKSTIKDNFKSSLPIVTTTSSRNSSMSSLYKINQSSFTNKRKWDDIAIRENKISAQTGKKGPVMLTAEEVAVYKQEKFEIPLTFPLTQTQERELKKVRRKIKNKLSAKASRSKKKAELEGLKEALEYKNKIFSHFLDCVRKNSLQREPLCKSCQELIKCGQIPEDKSIDETI